MDCNKIGANSSVSYCCCRNPRLTRDFLHRYQSPRRILLGGKIRRNGTVGPLDSGKSRVSVGESASLWFVGPDKTSSVQQRNRLKRGGNAATRGRGVATLR